MNAKEVEQVMNKQSRTADDWVCLLDKVIGSGQGWLRSLPASDEDGIPSVSAGKQLAEEACEFATSISSAMKLGHKVSAYANLRLLSDRFLHAVRFFEKPADVVAWEYWSMAKINQLLNDAMSQGAVDPQHRETIRELQKTIRHWNRSESGNDCQMSKPSKYDWHLISRELVGDSDARFKGAYDITSTYAHPTYRGDNPPDPGQEYVLEQAVATTCFTLIICAASRVPLEDDPPSPHIDQHLLDLLETLDGFTADSTNFAGAVKNPSSGVNEAQILYYCGTRLVKLVFGREVLSQQPDRE